MDTASFWELKTFQKLQSIRRIHVGRTFHKTICLIIHFRACLPCKVSPILRNGQNCLVPHNLLASFNFMDAIVLHFFLTVFLCFGVPFLIPNTSVGEVMGVFTILQTGGFKQKV